MYIQDICICIYMHIGVCIYTYTRIYKYSYIHKEATPHPPSLPLADHPRPNYLVAEVRLIGSRYIISIAENLVSSSNSNSPKYWQSPAVGNRSNHIR